MTIYGQERLAMGKNCDSCIGMGMIRDQVEDIPEANARVSTWHTCGDCGGTGDRRSARRQRKEK